MIGVAAEGTNCRVCSSCGSKQSKILPPGAVKVPPTKEHQRHLSKTQAKKFTTKASNKACARVPSLILIIAAENEREIDGQHQHSRHRHKKKNKLSQQRKQETPSKNSIILPCLCAFIVHEQMRSQYSGWELKQLMRSLTWWPKHKNHRRTTATQTKTFDNNEQTICSYTIIFGTDASRVVNYHHPGISRIPQTPNFCLTKSQTSTTPKTQLQNNKKHNELWTLTILYEVFLLF